MTNNQLHYFCKACSTTFVTKSKQVLVKESVETSTVTPKKKYESIRMFANRIGASEDAVKAYLDSRFTRTEIEEMYL